MEPEFPEPKPAISKPSVIEYPQLKTVDRPPDAPPPEEPAVSRRVIDFGEALRRLDAPARTRQFARSTQAAVKQGGRLAARYGKGLHRSGKTVGRWMSMDVETLVNHAVARVRTWSGAKEREIERLAQQAHFSVVSNRFRCLAALSGEERRRIEEVNCGERTMHQAGSDIALEGEGRSSPRLIVSGWASRMRIVGTRRQGLALLAPGDFIAMHPHGERRPSATVMALTAMETVDASAVLKMAGEAERYPGIADAMQRAAAQEMNFAENQICRLGGGMSELKRVAHLLAELHWRLIPTGLATDHIFPMPLTCETLADMLAMKPGRVRAALGRLRGMRLYSSRYCRVSVRDVARAEAFAGFRAPELLNVVSDEAAALMAAE